LTPDTIHQFKKLGFNRLIAIKISLLSIVDKKGAKVMVITKTHHA